MQTHSILRRDAENDTESYAKYQSGHGGIIVPSQVTRNEYPCPHSDENNGCGYYGTDDTGDDNVMSAAGNMVRKVGRHFIDEAYSVKLALETE